MDECVQAKDLFKTEMPTLKDPPKPSDKTPWWIWLTGIAVIVLALILWRWEKWKK